MAAKSILVRLDWPERCFRAGAREIALLRSLAPTDCEIANVRGEVAFLRRLPDATHAIVWRFKKEWFPLAKRLKVLATPGAGRELVAWRDAPRGVAVHFGRFHGPLIAESVAGFALAWARGFFRPEIASSRRAGSAPWAEAWPRAAIGGECFRVEGTKAVIAGFGNIGRAVGAKLESLGVEVAGFTRRNIGGLADAAKSADWFVMALPGDTGTDGFLGRRLISKLPRRCVVVNVGRGNAVDEAALLAALRSRRIAGAYLDVFDGERFGLGSAGAAAGAPVKKDGILGLPPSELPENLVAMPHSSAFSGDYLKLCFEELKREGLV